MPLMVLFTKPINFERFIIVFMMGFRRFRSTYFAWLSNKVPRKNRALDYPPRMNLNFVSWFSSLFPRCSSIRIPDMICFFWICFSPCMPILVPATLATTTDRLVSTRTAARLVKLVKRFFTFTVWTPLGFARELSDLRQPFLSGFGSLGTSPSFVVGFVLLDCHSGLDWHIPSAMSSMELSY